MKLQQLTKLLIASVSFSGLVIAGCTQERNFDRSQDNTQTQPVASTEQVQPTTQVQPTAQVQQREPDVPFVPTPQEVVNKMLEVANVNSKDVVYDLGSGDGRIVITAAQKFGARGTGIDIDPQLIEQSRANAQTAGVADRVQFRQQDLFQADLSNATVVTLYLLPEINLQIRDKLLRELRPGTRIVSHNFDMGEWKPERVERVQTGIREHVVYYWVVPEQVSENVQN
ncbi:class I SAM-dependent methyltransferase [Floridanema aerugineum]|uniref:Class I SAM-dependent methyltransferase n=1 Tax=Floridaenema aerugineum BLCC-F46 TaxID=3153654 RepID=A0ABV4X1Z1_9CYAN